MSQKTILDKEFRDDKSFTDYMNTLPIQGYETLEDFCKAYKINPIGKMFFGYSKENFEGTSKTITPLASLKGIKSIEMFSNQIGG